MIEFITPLTEKDKEFLKSKSPYALPDNPSNKGLSANQITSKLGEGLFVLFDWMKEEREQMTRAIIALQNEIDELKKK